MKKAHVTPPPRPRGRPRKAEGLAPQARARRAAGRLLSNKEKAVMCQLARVAFDHLAKLGLAEGKFQEWRRAQQADAVGLESLTDCTRDHWRPLAAHYSTLLGWTHRAFLLWMTTGRATDASAPADTHEAREEALHLILGELADHARRVHTPANVEEFGWSEHARSLGGPIGETYIESIARIQHGTGLRGLTASQLEQMLSTVRNRIAAREGRGRSLNRNRKQRVTAAQRRKEDKEHGTRPR